MLLTTDCYCFTQFQINDRNFILPNDEDSDNECSMSNDCDSLENFVLSNEVNSWVYKVASI